MTARAAVRALSFLAFLSACGAPVTRPEPCPAPPACACEAATADREALERIARLEEERAALTEALLRRTQAADAGVATADAATTLPAAVDAAYAQLRVTLAQQERQSAECDDVLDLVTRLRAVAQPGSPPAICRDAALRSRVATGTTSGAPMSSLLGTIGERIDAVCTPFDRWATPDERGQTVIATYGEQVDRVEHWLADFGTCLGATGRRAFECDNTYGAPIDTASIAEAARAHDLVVALQRELAASRAGHAPFPCTTPTLARIDAVTTWRGTMAAAQMPGLPHGAAHVCEVIGVDDHSVGNELHSLSRLLDSTELNARTRKTAVQQAITSLRANLPDGG